LYILVGQIIQIHYMIGFKACYYDAKNREYIVTGVAKICAETIIYMNNY
jgi:hypothetical protein